MHFLPDVYVVCDVCKSKRYNRETLEVKYKGKSISEVLELTIESAREFFDHFSQATNAYRRGTFIYPFRTGGDNAVWGRGSASQALS